MGTPRQPSGAGSGTQDEQDVSASHGVCRTTRGAAGVQTPRGPGEPGSEGTPAGHGARPSVRAGLEGSCRGRRQAGGAGSSEARLRGQRSARSGLQSGSPFPTQQAPLALRVRSRGYESASPRRPVPDSSRLAGPPSACPAAVGGSTVGRARAPSAQAQHLSPAGPRRRRHGGGAAVAMGAVAQAALTSRRRAARTAAPAGPQSPGWRRGPRSRPARWRGACAPPGAGRPRAPLREYGGRRGRGRPEGRGLPSRWGGVWGPPRPEGGSGRGGRLVRLRALRHLLAASGEGRLMCSRCRRKGELRRGGRFQVYR